MINITKKSPLVVSEEVREALDEGQPVVALESSAFCQGLPIDIANSAQADIENAVRKEGAAPATISILHGRILVGTSDADREQLLALRIKKQLNKVAKRDIAHTLVLRASGGTTVSASSFIASLCGVKVFATGGLGGVHRMIGGAIDISADLLALAEHPVVVVCAGVKSILDVKNTLEILESLSVPVISLDSKLFPNFYCSQSTVKSPLNIRSLAEIKDIFCWRQHMNFKESMVLAVPSDPNLAIDTGLFEDLLAKGLLQAAEQGISHQAVTPFLLQYVAQHTNGQTVRANVALIKKNAQLAAELAGLFD